MDFNFSLHNKQLEVSTVIEDFTSDNGQFSSCKVDMTVDIMADVLLAVYSHLTPRVDIWHWFENRFNLSIGKDLNG
jgi:hypothetical protein